VSRGFWLANSSWTPAFAGVTRKNVGVARKDIGQQKKQSFYPLLLLTLWYNICYNSVSTTLGIKHPGNNFPLPKNRDNIGKREVLTMPKVEESEVIKAETALNNLVGRTNSRLLQNINFIRQVEKEIQSNITEIVEGGKARKEKIIIGIRDYLEDLCDEMQLDSCGHVKAAKIYPTLAKAIFTIPLDNAAKVSLFREFDAKIFKDRKVGDLKLIILNRDLVKLLKLAIMDVDNTIIMSGAHELKPEMVEQIKKMIEKRMRVRFISGRGKWWCVAALKALLGIPGAIELCEIWYESGCGQCDLKGNDLGLAPGLENHPVITKRQEVYDFFSSLCLTQAETPPDTGAQCNKEEFVPGQDANGQKLIFPVCSTKVAGRYTLSFNLKQGDGPDKDFQVTLEMCRIYDANGKVINDPVAEEMQEASMKLIAMAIKNKGWDKYFSLAKVGTAINVNPVINGEIIGKSRAAGMIIEETAKEFGLTPQEVAANAFGIGDGKADGEFSAAMLSDKTVVRPLFFFVGPPKQFDFDEEVFDRIVAVAPKLIDDAGAWGDVASIAIFQEFSYAFASFDKIPPGNNTPETKIVPEAEILPPDFFPQPLIRKKFEPESPDPDYFRYENAQKDPIFRAWLKANGQTILTLGMFARPESTQKILCYEVRPESRILVSGKLFGEVKKLMKPEERLTPSGGSSNIIATLDGKRYLVTQRRSFLSPKGDLIPLAGHLNNNIGYPAYHPKYGEDLFAQIKGVIADNFFVEHVEEFGVIDSATGEFYHPRSLLSFNEAVFSDFDSAFQSAWQEASKILERNPNTKNIKLSKICKFAPSAKIEFCTSAQLRLHFPEEKDPYTKRGTFNFEKNAPNCNGFDVYLTKLPFPSSRLRVIDCEENLNLPSVLLELEEQGFAFKEPLTASLIFQNGERLDPETLPRKTELEIKEYESLTSNIKLCPVLEDCQAAAKSGVADIILSD